MQRRRKEPVAMPQAAETLTRAECERYARHLSLPEVGMAGQSRLKAARVLVAGAGGLGAPALTYLAAAGIGTLGVVEFDVIDRSNLQRQVLYDEADIGRPKLWRAKARLQAQNPGITVQAHEGPLDADNVAAILADYDLVLDGTDNFVSRYLLNDACRLLGKPLVHASLYRFEGQVTVFLPDRPGCYRCLFPMPPSGPTDCSTAGVLGVLAGTVGTLQATEALKLLLGVGEPLVGRLMIYDALRMAMTTLGVPADPDCPLCGSEPTITRFETTNYTCFGRGPDEDDEIPPHWEMSLGHCRQRLAEIVLLDVRERLGADGLLAGAQHLPLSQLSDRLAELPQDRDVVFACWSGSTSAQATRLARAAGFEQAFSLRGGLRAWHTGTAGPAPADKH
jgi:adenylyltransferase/sulfurtransferase